jgi:hypothetical protein
MMSQLHTTVFMSLAHRVRAKLLLVLWHSMLTAVQLRS